MHVLRTACCLQFTENQMSPECPLNKTYVFYIVVYCSRRLLSHGDIGLQIWKAKTLAITTAVVAVLPLACIFFEIPAAAGFYYIGPNQLTDYFTNETVIFVGDGSFAATHALF